MIRYRLLALYHENGWGAVSILFQKLVYPRHLDCENTADNVGEPCPMSQHLANMGQIGPNWVLLCLSISGLRDEHSNWATSFRNASRKEPDAPPFHLVTSQLPDKSQLINKPGASESGMALFGTTYKKRNFNPTSFTSSRGKSTYKKAIAKCTQC